MNICFKQNKQVDEVTVTVENKENNQAVTKLLTYLNEYQQQTQRLTIEKDGEIYQLPFHELLWIEVIGDYTSIHTDQMELRIRKTLQSIETELPAAYFIRASRNTLINLTKIKRVERHFSGTMRAILSHNQSIHISRNYWKNIKQRILNDD